MIQNFTKKHRGFTLVELLVVIAIIGLLASIVLVSFGPVRTQARDTAVKANMSQMRLAAEVQYLNDTNYMNAVTRSDYLAANNAANAAGATAFANNWVANAYCFSYTLPGTTKWCIDSTGATGSSLGVCNTNTGKCAAS